MYAEIFILSPTKRSKTKRQCLKPVFRIRTCLAGSKRTGFRQKGQDSKLTERFWQFSKKLKPKQIVPHTSCLPH